MKKEYRIQHNFKIIIYTLVTVVLLSATIGIMIASVYNQTEKEAFEKLHMETQQIKNEVNLQMYSDRENLITMANFAAKLYEGGNGFEMVFHSFEEIGLFEDVRILLPNNSLLTKNGEIPNVDNLNFADEKERGEYISGRVTDLVHKEKEVVRSAVPIITNDYKIVGIIYGIIDLQKFEDRYLNAARTLGADLFLLDQRTGEFIIDTKRKNFGDITELATTTFEDGYSYEGMVRELSTGADGFASFDSIVTGKKLYAHYAPLNFATWQIMLAKPAEEVFSSAVGTGRYMLIMAAVLIFIMLLYVLFVFISERNTLNISSTASIVRKSLLEANRNSEKMSEALQKVTSFLKARSAFFVDNYGESYGYISPTVGDNVISVAERKNFMDELLYYVTKYRTKRESNVYIINVKTDSQLYERMPKLYELAKKHNIHTVDIAGVTHSNSNTSLLCVVNPKKKDTKLLLQEIAVCFSMTVYNKKHLVNTEEMAYTDALTGVANRMAYKRDLKMYSKQVYDRFTCIYIDVNELNYFNNNYGHAAGDQMLAYIAEALMREFADGKVYRMGGDEFLIFVHDTKRDEIISRIERFNSNIEEMKYHVSVGIKKKTQDMSIEELVNEAEKKMYLEKAKYYQSRDNEDENTEQVNLRMENVCTGVKEVDAYLSILRNKYFGVYYVSLETDKSVQLLAPSYYFSMASEENKFSDVMKQYIHENVKPEFYRTLLSFIQYDVIEGQIKDGIKPQISYIKKDGHKVRLSVWAVPEEMNEATDTIWIFEKEEKDN